MMDFSRLAFRVEPMMSQDIDSVMEIENKSFSLPWSARAYEYELHYNPNARYYVARHQNGMPVSNSTRRSFWRWLLSPDEEYSSRTPLVGYSGYWLMINDAHISTIAVHPQWRRHGIGELLLLAMIDSAVQVGAQAVTLEVRMSNVTAQALYRKYGFEPVGERLHYYSDNGENALIMTTPTITLAEFQQKLKKLHAALYTRLSSQSECGRMSEY